MKLLLLVHNFKHRKIKEHLIFKRIFDEFLKLERCTRETCRSEQLKISTTELLLKLVFTCKVRAENELSEVS